MAFSIGLAIRPLSTAVVVVLVVVGMVLLGAGVWFRFGKRK